MEKQDASLDASFWIKARKSTLLRKLILEGLERYRIEEAVTAYAHGASAPA